MKSIITYSRELKAQNLYPRRIISPPAPNKCCRFRMEVLGRPRADEQGRRFCYKRCKVCGFAVRHFLDSVGTVVTPVAQEVKARKASPVKARPPVLAGHPAARSVMAAPRKTASSRHVSRKVSRHGAHPVGGGRKSAARRRR